jgi:hypothetical protein
MAHNEFRSFRTQSASWRALASAAVATTLAVALVVSALALLEAAVSTPASQVAKRFPSRTEAQPWHARTQHVLQRSNLCARDEPAPCLTD